MAELNRLNEELAQIRESSLQKLVQSLQLDDIGISRRTKTSLKSPSTFYLESKEEENFGKFSFYRWV